MKESILVVKGVRQMESSEKNCTVLASSTRMAYFPRAAATG